MEFTLIEQGNNTINTDIATVKIRQKRTEDFWILKLDTITPNWLNKELNNVPSSDLLDILCSFLTIINQLLQRRKKYLIRKH